MNESFKKWLTPQSMLLGAALICAVGFGFNIVTFSGPAKSAADAQSRAAVVAALTPICVAAANADPMRDQRLAELNEASTYKRPSIVTDYGWATFPGTDKSNDSVAKACVTEALKLQPAA